MVLDWLMPGMKGNEVASRIKTEIRPQTDPHIVLISGFSSGDVMDKPGGEYIDQFLTKPVSPSHLFDAVMAAFGIETGHKKAATLLADSSTWTACARYRGLRSCWWKTTRSTSR